MIDRGTTHHMDHGEKFNAVTHLVGAVLALVGSVVLIVLAARNGDPWQVVSVSIYGVTLVLLYSISTLYHSNHGHAKIILRKLDHLSIYLLIAGSYTPFCLVTLRGPWGWSLLGVVWGLAVLGCLQELRPRGGARILSVVLYVVMGWVVLVALVPLLHALGSAGFAWLAAGGAFYTVGIVFYALGSRQAACRTLVVAVDLQPTIPKSDRLLAHSHGIWHLFVIAGSAAHYFVILRYVLGGA